MTKRRNPRNCKTFVLDTNVILHDPKAIYKFEDNRVVLTMQTLVEMDSKKSEPGSIGRNARQVHRDLRKMFGPLMGQEFVGGVAEAQLPTGGSIMVMINPFLSKKGTPDYVEAMKILGEPDHPDNKILLTAKAIAETTKPPVIFVTKDSNAAIKAMMIGLLVEDYKNDQVPEAEQEEYYPIIDLPEHLFERFSTEGAITIPEAKDLEVNDYVIFSLQGGHELAARHRGNGRFTALQLPEELTVPGGRSVSPKNIEQAIFMDALLDPSINLVSAIGRAGTGKTLLAVACALNQVLQGPNSPYKKIMITRSIVTLGKDMGALPGSKEEKLNPFLQPYYDNLEVLLGGARPQQQAKQESDEIPAARPNNISRKSWRRLQDLLVSDPDKAKEYYSRLGNNQHRKEKGENKEQRGNSKPQKPYQWLLDTGLMELEAMAYVRGRSIPNSFIIVDESQNLTAHEVKTIVTRLAEGSKIILIGDPAQIDTPLLDASSCGLNYVRQKMRGAEMAASVKLVKSVRSKLAEEAAKRL